MLTDRDNLILQFIEQYGGITIKQASKLFFREAKYSDDIARKRLKKLAENEELKYDKDWVTNQRVYYTKKKPSSHTLVLLNLYSEIVGAGADIIEFEKEYKIDNICRPDGFVIFSYNGKGKVVFIEVDMQNKTSLEKYQKLYETQLFQKEYGTFPEVIILCSNRNYDIKGYPFSIKLLDYKLTDLKQSILNF